MKSRILPLLALLGALLLSACGGSGETPAATATTAPASAPTSAATAAPTATVPAQAPTTAPTEGVSATPAATTPAETPAVSQAATTTPAGSGGAEPALALQSVPIETNDTTATGAFAGKRQLNLPP